MTTTPTETDHLHAYTIEEFASRMRLNARTIERKIKAGEIKAVKLGRITRIPHTELVRVLTPA